MKVSEDSSSLDTIFLSRFYGVAVSMKKSAKKIISLVLGGFIFCHSLMAGETPVKDLYQYKLDNGLEFFVAENHNAPLVYIEIAIKAGAGAQNPENAGLFHLYEHMMFKGNYLYKDAASVQTALNNLGVSNWNGTTGVDCVNYYFTVPSSKLAEGLAFWNAAIRSPLMDPKEFENEKKVVIAEIESDKKEPGSIFGNYYRKVMFPDAPYRVDSGGSEYVVKNASISQMYEMKDKYYIPCNAALFVGGDVNRDDVEKLVKQIFGSWSNKGKSVPEVLPQQNLSPLPKPLFCVTTNDKVLKETAQISISYRGPDTDYNVEDTYDADYLCTLLNDPQGDFKQNLFKNKTFMIPSTSSIWGGYGTVRATGLIRFGTTMLSPDNNIAHRTKTFYSELAENVLPKIAQNKKNFSRQKVDSVRNFYADERIESRQTAKGLLTNLRFWWVCSSPDYYYTYLDNLEKVNQSSMNGFMSRYIFGKSPLVTLTLNPEVYEANKESLAQAGFYKVPDDEKPWWEEEKYSSMVRKIDSEQIAFETDEKIYVHVGESSSFVQKERQAPKIIESKLANNIPVYIQVSDSEINSVFIGVKGGIDHLEKSTSGLERTLFSMMGYSSKNYSYSERQKINFKTGMSVGSMIKVSGSALCFSVMEKYFDKTLPVFIDGFLNPAYESGVFENVTRGLKNNLLQKQNDPESIMSERMMNDLYAGHPFEVRNTVTMESIDSITVENMKNLHKKLLSGGEIFVVASGKIDEKKFIKALDKTLGKLKFNYEKVSVNSVPPVSIKKNDNVILTHPSCGVSGYAQRVFATAVNTSDEFIPCVIASEIYSTMMFNIIREHYGICYSTSSFAVGSKAAYGCEYFYRVSNHSQLVAAADECRGYMSRNMVVEKTDQSGNYVFTTVGDSLEGAKSKYINMTFDALQTPFGQAQNLVYNLLTFDDMFHDLKNLERLDTVTEKDVLDAFNKYWVNGNSIWYFIVSPENTSKVQF